MALPDISGLTADELALLIERAKVERINRGRYDDIRAYLIDELTAAKGLGVTKAQVGNFLTAVVNEVYPPA